MGVAVRPQPGPPGKLGPGIPLSSSALWPHSPTYQTHGSNVSDDESTLPKGLAEPLVTPIATDHQAVGDSPTKKP